ncbi:MAG: hypothetical protein ACO3A4_08760 [Silvanigrellaceae bacterium]
MKFFPLRPDGIKFSGELALPGFFSIRGHWACFKQQLVNVASLVREESQLFSAGHLGSRILRPTKINEVLVFASLCGEAPGHRRRQRRRQGHEHNSIG